MAATATEKSEGAPAAAPPMARKLMSPAAYAVIAVVMLATAGVVYFVTKNFHQTAPEPEISGMYEEVSLDQMNRELAPDSVNLVRDRFMVKVVLVLNPKFEHLAEMKALVEKRRNSLKDVVLSEILYPKTDAELRKPGILETLRMEIKTRLNAELGSSKEGQEMIVKVIFPESQLPARR